VPSPDWRLGFQRRTTIYEIFDMTVGSIYTHVIFDTLLSRVRLRERLAEGGPVDLMTSLQLHPDTFQEQGTSPVTKVPDGVQVASDSSIGNLTLVTSDKLGSRGSLEEGDVESDGHVNTSLVV